MEKNDYPLGSTFEHEGNAILVVEDTTENEEDGVCEYCYFYESAGGCKQYPCTHDFRDDKKDVYYIKQ